MRWYANRITLDTPPDFPGAPGTPKADIYAVPGDPNGNLSALAGSLALQVGSSNVWVCAGGLVWSLIPLLSSVVTNGLNLGAGEPVFLDKLGTLLRFKTLLAGAGIGFTVTPTTLQIDNTGGGGGGARATFVLRPGGVADPANGVFTTWATAQAAASAAEGQKLISVEPITPATSVNIGPAAAYDMEGIRLAGPITTGALMDIDDGVTFTNWSGGTDWLELDFNGTVLPLFTIDTGGGGATYRMVSGRSATWRSLSTAEVVRVTNSSFLAMDLDEGTTIGTFGDGGGNEAFGVPGAGDTIQFNVSDAVTINDNNVARAGNLGSALVSILGGQTLFGSVFFGGTISPLQPNLAGGGFFAVFGTQAFQAPVPAFWGGPGPPISNEAAINRMAAVLFANFGAIP